MRRNGFTLIELLVVIAIVGILLAIGALGFSRMTLKSGIERQTKELYADLMSARAEALFRKTPRSLGFSFTNGNQWYSIYQSADKTGAPVLSKKLPYTINSSRTDADFLSIDEKGMAATAQTDITATPMAVCAQQTGVGSVDSIIITATSIQMGTLSGTGCTYDKIVPK